MVTTNDDNKKVKLPGEAYSSKIRARFWITGEKDSYIGIGRIELLEHIDELGSMNKAAKKMGMSYKKAWKLIEELNSMYDEPLVIKEHGGKQGGGTFLTDRGKKLVLDFKRLEKELVDFLVAKSSEL